MKTKTAVHVQVFLLMAVLETACNSDGGGNGGSGTGGAGGAAASGAGGGGPGGATSFTPATPPADICSMLTLADVQAVLPSATAGVERPTANSSAVGFWSRDCKWDAGSTSLELVVFGALTQAGLDGIKAAARSGEVNTPVSGLGEEAHYWEDGTHGTSGLWALKAPYSVDTTKYAVKPFPTADQFKPLVVKALGQLP